MKRRSSIAVLAYHKVDPSFEWGVTRITPNQFLRHLTLFRELEFEPCSLGEYLEGDSTAKVAITFDDAYESLYHHAYPHLQEGKISFTVFLVAGYVGEWNRWEVNLGWRRFRHLSWEQLRSMQGVEIGSHTLTHPSLPGLNHSDLRKELQQSREIIEDRLGCKVRYLSLPFGRYNQRVLDSAREAGYEAVCSMNPDDGDGFLVGRYGVYRLDTPTTIRSKLGVGKMSGFEKVKLKAINRLSAGTIMVKRWRKRVER